MSAFQSTWGNTQQNQQQQPNAFGQPSGFGTSAFGSSSAFGQNQQQQQQPAANPMFGNLGGTPNTNTGTTGFGAFGNTTNASQGTSAFGTSKPATGFGAFGGGAFGGGGTFGQTNTPAGGSGTTGMFGQPASTSTTGAFGNTGMFGANKTTSGFGTTTGGTQGTPAPVTTGSSNPPFQAYSEKENGNSGPVNIQYQAISCMPAYQGISHEEIRYQDYLQGRKTAGAFGQSAAFGTTQPTNTGIFGTQPAQQNQPSAFGAGTTSTTGFGGFGASTTNQGTTAPTTTGGFGGGLFGQQPQPQPQPQPQQSAFGGFGNTTQQPQQQSGGLFGNTFGNNQAKPAGFSAFGGGGGGTFGGGAFGTQPQQQPQQQQQQQQQQQPAGGLFGNTQTQPATGFNAFSNTGNKSIFGGTQPTTNQPPTTGFGNFGATQQQNQPGQQQQPSLFGGSTGGGLFGGGSQQQQQNPQQPANNPLFGNTNPQTGGGLFGGANLFGANNQQQQPGQTGAFNLFGGNKPAAPNQSIFSSGFNQQPANNAQQPSIFGAPLGQSTNQPSTLGGGLFGNKPAAPLLGSSTSTGQGGLFGSSGILNASANTPGAQGSLTASISQPIGANLAIFDMLPPGPRLVNLENSQPKKKTGFFVDIPTRSPVPRVQLGYTPANSKLRGFGSSTSAPSIAGGNPFASLSFTPGKPNALSLSRVSDNKPAIGPDTFLSRSSSPSLGSGARQSVKKVILDKKVDPAELFTKSGGSPGSLRGGKVVFSPALSVAVREKDATAALNSSTNGTTNSPTPAPRPQRTPNRFTAQSTQNALQPDGPADQADSSALEEGDYWVKPDLATLKQTGYDELSTFKDLIVGRKGYGEIHFLEPVDLTGLPKLGALLGEIVRFDDKECSVYPDSEEVDKPPPGSGLNVRARLTLVRCWAVDKATREPIKDAKHLAAVKHLKRLKNMKDTHFESFDINEGEWNFVVDHF